MSTRIDIHGECDPRFAAVRAAFAENFAARGEVGAAVAVTLDGRPVVDLWAGHADAARTRPWQRDTIVNVFSVTKGMTALCAHILADRGVLDLDAPVARYWPEFAQAGKAELPVHYLLSHRAGLPAIKKPLAPEALFEWGTMTAALAEQEPWWEPGTRLGYHPFTYGWLVGEVVRRVSGKSVGTFFRDEVARPLGLDFHIGLAAEHDARVAAVTPGPPPPLTEAMLKALQDPESMLSKVFFNPPRSADVVNTRAWRAAELPAVNGHGTGRALARVYGALACGGEGLLRPEAIARATVEQACGVDLIMGLPGRMGLGFMLTAPETPFGPNPRAFGCTGAGGSVGFADPDARLGFGYVMNQMHAQPLPLVATATALIDAVYAALER